MHAVLELGERGDPRGILPLYELAQDEAADAEAREAAAEALVTLGLLRRRRVGPSRMFLWLLGATLVIVSAAAVSSVGPVAAIALFAAGAAALIGFHHWAARRERESGTYIGPDGATIQMPV